MDILSYYQRIRAQEQKLHGEFVWVTSHSSRNGGVAGRVCEVPTKVAAKLIVDGEATLALAEEVEEEIAHLQAVSRRSNPYVCSSFVVGNNG